MPLRTEASQPSWGLSTEVGVGWATWRRGSLWSLTAKALGVAHKCRARLLLLENAQGLAGGHGLLPIKPLLGAPSRASLPWNSERDPRPGSAEPQGLLTCRKYTVSDGHCEDGM